MINNRYCVHISTNDEKRNSAITSCPEIFGANSTLLSIGQNEFTDLYHLLNG